MDKAMKKIEQGDAWEDTDTIVELKAKKPLDKVIPIRLQADHWEKLRELAGETGVGPTTLVRMWILDRLRSETAGYRRTAIKVSDIKGKYLKSGEKENTMRRSEERIIAGEKHRGRSSGSTKMTSDSITHHRH